MKQITKKTIKAFLEDRTYKLSNTFVSRDNTMQTTRLYLFGNLIAKRTPEGIFITNAGWFSNTTKERLNGIPGVNISQKKGVWYLNGNRWNGNLIKL